MPADPESLGIGICQNSLRTPIRIVIMRRFIEDTIAAGAFLLCAAGLAAQLPAAEKSETAPPRATPPSIPALPPGVDETSPLAGELLEKHLEEWPDHPEWLAMYADILQGSRLGPGEGWFKKAVSQTRFSYEATCQAYDRDGDKQIARAEFPGSDQAFARLDRNRNQTLDQADWDWSQHALAPTPGMILFRMGDGDGNGQLNRREWEGLFDRLAGKGTEFLSIQDLQEALAPTGMPPRDPAPTKATLLKGLFQQEIGSLKPGPALNESVPKFVLKTHTGDQEYSLEDHLGKKPLILIFGNFTCGPFRMASGDVEKLYERYQDQAEFAMVYVREAHPTDGWHMPSNDRHEVKLPQPQTLEQRASVASACQAKLGLQMPMLVDTIDDYVGANYSGMPSRLYLIDRDGRVAFKSGRGPFGFKPAELEQALLLMLAQPDSAASKPKGST